MKESKGKASARKYFYEEILAGCFSSEELWSKDCLVLLGEEKRELPFILSKNIVSLERNRKIFLRQKREQDERIRYYNCEAVDYLAKLHRAKKDFAFLNLDVEGTYFNQINPAISSVLLYALKNPAVLVATCSTIGRDTEVIWEGIKSLAIFLWLAEKETLEFVQKRYTSYRIAKYENPIRMVVRDLYWLRSHLEHSLVVSTSLGAIESGSMKMFFWTEEIIWKKIINSQQCKINSMLDLIQENPVIVKNLEEIKLSVGINFISQVVYKAAHPWKQAIYVARYQKFSEPIDCSDWARKMLADFSKSPLISFGKNGRMKDIARCDYMQSLDKIMRISIWHKPDIKKYQPKKVNPNPFSRKLALAMIADIPKMEKGRKEDKVEKLVNEGKLTDSGIVFVKKLAKEGKSTEEIQSALGEKSEALWKIIRAYVAYARRTQTGKSIVLKLTPKETLAYEVIVECLKNADKTAEGKRKRGLVRCCEEVMAQRKMKGEETTSNWTIHYMIKELVKRGALDEVMRNRLKGEKLNSIVYGVHDEVLNKIIVKPKNKKINKKAVSPKKSSKTDKKAHLAQSTGEAAGTSEIVVKIRERIQLLGVEISEREAERKRLEDSLKVITEFSK